MTVAFITGAGGQDGTLLTQDLLARGQKVHGLFQKGTGTGTADAQPTAQGIVAHYGDLGDGHSVPSLIRQIQPDVIYNLGGISSVGFSWEEPGLTGRVSGQGAVDVFEAAWRLREETGKRVAVVQASSAEVFGSPETTPQTEDTPLAPVSPYGAAKAYAQSMGQAYRAKGLPLTTLILYAHESPLRPPSFVTRKITQAAARIAVDGSGELALGNMAAVRDWGWAPDYVAAMQLAADHLLSGDQGAEYVVATGAGHTVQDFVQAAFDAVGIQDWEKHVRVDPKFFRPADPALLVGNSAKIRRELGWAPTVSFEEVVQAMCSHDLELARTSA